MDKVVRIFTDGACSGNPGPGGFGVIITFPAGAGSLSYEHSAGYALTTNNRMELLAVIFGLEQVKDNCTIEITTDSAYVVNAINKGWLNSWIENGWRTADRKPVKNKDLWLRYLDAAKGKKVKLIWTKGHNENATDGSRCLENERCDYLAVSAYSKSMDDLLEDTVYLDGLTG